MQTTVRLLLVTALAALVTCGPATRSPPTPIVVPIASGPLVLRVVYPLPGTVIAARDSTFLFGTVGRGDATLTVNGEPVRVLANGSWIAWLPLPEDTVATFRLVARAGADTMSDSLYLGLAGFRAPCWWCAWVDSTSFSPAGRLELPPDEGLRVTARATPGAEVWLLLPDSTSVPLVPDTLPEEPSWGERAFAADPSAARLPVRADRYLGWVRAGQLIGVDDSITAVVHVAVGADTVRHPWPVTMVAPVNDPPLVVVLNDDTLATGDTDSLTVGRALPGGTYHWFLPTGTPARVSGRANGLLRLALSRRAVAWVDSSDARPLPRGTPPPSAVVRSLRLHPLPDRVQLRIPLSSRVPFRIDEGERELAVTLYGARGDIDWMQYGETESPVQRLAWRQAAEDEVVVTVRLASAVWGYRAHWQGRDLLVDVRRPPVVDPGQPLAGRAVLLDAGHPPLGSTGPSGQREADVTLAVARLARRLLEARGARVQLTRDADTAVSLTARVNLAERGGAEALVSIHTNALPDGVNPFPNHGSSTYYFHPRSLPLARAINRAVVDAFGTRDLGVGQGDLALARPTWLPAVLVEGLFQMMPEHDAWLASEEGRRRYAQAIVDGLAAFFAESARER